MMAFRVDRFSSEDPKSPQEVAQHVGNNRANNMSAYDYLPTWLPTWLREASLALTVTGWLVTAALSFIAGHIRGKRDRADIARTKAVSAIERALFEVSRVEYLNNYSRATYPAISAAVFDYCGHVAPRKAERMKMCLHVYQSRDCSDPNTAVEALSAPLRKMLELCDGRWIRFHWIRK